MKTQTTRQEASTRQTLFCAIEMSGSKWLLAFRDGVTDKIRHRSVNARDIEALAVEMRLAKQHLRLGPKASVRSCYEAGRDGYWLHRWLLAQKVENLVLDPASIQVDRRMRRAKTDRLDASALVAALIRLSRGETEACRAVRVPSVDQEDARRDSRERERLQHEEAGHRSRISALVALHGVADCDPYDEHLEELHSPVGESLPPALLAELKREQERLELVHQQKRDLERRRRSQLRAPSALNQALLSKVLALMGLAGVGEISAWQLVHEFFFRTFKNRRQVGSAAGLVNAPYASGAGERDQGITKAGNARVRTLMVELAWMWLRFQPESALAQWFHKRFGQGKRTRRVGIVARARRLLIALWRYVEMGVVPDGAHTRTPKLVA
jgi:transposase